MTIKIKVINNKNQNMKHKDNNLQIPITLLNLIDSMISVLITLALGAYKYISFPDHTFFSGVDQMNPVFALVMITL
jgi:hypothetical protein